MPVWTFTSGPNKVRDLQKARDADVLRRGVLAPDVQEHEGDDVEDEGVEARQGQGDA